MTNRRAFEGGVTMPIQLASPAFKDGEFIPIRYTSQSGERSPPLQWSGVPKSTRSFVVLLDDTDAPGGPRCHWILFDVPASRQDLPEHVTHQASLQEGPKDGIRAKQGRNDFGKVGYVGPVPYADRAHRYSFTLYALDCVLHLPPGANKTALLGAVAGHVLEASSLNCLWSE